MVNTLHPAHRAEPVSVVAEAEFTEDMAETLCEYFQSYAVDGVVRIEVSNRGLWLQNPATGRRQFLGIARFPKALLDA